MENEVLILLDAARKFVPKEALRFFPNEVDGYMFFVERENGVEVWNHIYPDEHPWKERPSKTFLVEVVSKQIARHINQAVKVWNDKAQKQMEQQKAEEVKELEAIENWLLNLPKTICGYTRCGSILEDRYGNHIADLTGTTFCFKTVEQLEADFEEFFIE